MKTFTINLLRFAGVLLLLTVTFRFELSTLLNREEFILVWLICALYALLVFTAGWFFGKKGYEDLPLSDIGFWFHLTTYVICNSIAELWFLLGFQSEYENIKAVHLTVLFWGIGMIIHFIFFLIARSDNIKGIDKSDIFE